MTVRYLVLKNELEDELDKLNKLAEKILLDREKHRESEIYVESAAMNLQSYYTGVERVFKTIAAKLDGEVPAGERWHKDLLDQVAIEIPSIRPPVISKLLRDELGKYLAFRHVIRNIYPYDLDSQSVADLVDNLSRVHEQLREGVEQFLSFIAAIGNET